ncbi:T9SS type A sorting domain-containing protein [bacterium]|nr:T9SS type A sorting domain-containing protein [bacterium]
MKHRITFNFFILIIIQCFLLFSIALSANFTVGSVLEFQSALNTAETNGENDTINVSAGTYDITTTLTYNSGENYSLTILGAGMGLTILDGGNTAQISNLMSGASDADLTIKHITFQNGNSSADGGALYIETTPASITIDSSEFDGNYAVTLGGGVNAVSNSGNIYISNCFFRNDTCYYNAGGLNAGVTDGNITLTDCTIENNIVLDLVDSASHVGGDGAGALLYIDNTGTIIMTGNTFTGNYAPDDGGGGFTYQLGTDVSVTVANNTFTNNHAELGGGGFYGRITSSGTMDFEHNDFSGNSTAVGDGAGAHIEINTGTLDFNDNTFIDNISGANGGGATIENDAGISQIMNNTFTDNHAIFNGAGANIFTENGTVTINRNISNSNSAESIGGGMSIATTTGTLNIFNNTFYGDSADDGGGLYFYFDQATAIANIYNNILWHCIPQAISMSGAMTVSATYSDIESGTGELWFGIGCIDSYPLFADTAASNFHLTWVNYPIEDATKSPCIDTGDPSSLNDPDGTIADMGAFYYSQSTEINNNHSRIQSTHFNRNYPNPFNSTTAISYFISKSQNINIQIFDINGQLIKTLVDNYKTEGNHTILWNAEHLPSGIYFCKLKTEKSEFTRRIIFIK